MKIKTTIDNYKGIKFTLFDGSIEAGRTYLYVMRNDLHPEPFGFIEDVYVEKAYRGKGYGSKIIKKLVTEAKKMGLYKLICNSRFKNEKVHRWYELQGFKKHGYEFRLDLKN